MPLVSCFCDVTGYVDVSLVSHCCDVIGYVDVLLVGTFFKFFVSQL